MTSSESFNEMTYGQMVDEQAEALTAATGLVWTHEETGGGHDGLVAHFDNPDDYGNEYPRLAYVMLTCDASVVHVGHDRSACVGFYPNSDMWEDMEREGNIGGDDDTRLLTVDDLCDFVGQWLRRWGVI